jgi:hypothetical protein
MSLVDDGHGRAFGGIAVAAREEPNGLAAEAALPTLLLIIAITTFFPEELSFPLFGLRMTVTRLVLLLATPVVIFRFFDMIGTGRYRFVWSDPLSVILALWFIVSASLTSGFDRGLVYGGTTALEFCVTYMAARSLLQSPGQAVLLVRVICICIAVVGVLAVLDTLTGEYFVRQATSLVTGYVKNYRYDYRLGNTVRATSTIEHPILLGSVCCFGVLLALPLRGRIRSTAIAGSLVGLALSISTAPMMGLVIGLFLVAYDRVMREVSTRWLLAMALLVTAVTIIFMVHPNPRGFVFQYMTFNPLTAYSHPGRGGFGRLGAPGVHADDGRLAVAANGHDCRYSGLRPYGAGAADSVLKVDQHERRHDQSNRARASPRADDQHLHRAHHLSRIYRPLLGDDLDPYGVAGRHARASGCAWPIPARRRITLNSCRARGSGCRLRSRTFRAAPAMRPLSPRRQIPAAARFPRGSRSSSPDAAPAWRRIRRPTASCRRCRYPAKHSRAPCAAPKACRPQGRAG